MQNDLISKSELIKALRKEAEECEQEMVVPSYWTALRIVKEQPVVENTYNNWIPENKPPKEDEYVLLSFDNFDVPIVGRYEEDEDGGGAYYVGDEDEPLVKQGMFVNGWMPLPEPYRETAATLKMTNAERIQSMNIEELAEALLKIQEIEEYIPFCTNAGRCMNMLDSGKGFTTERVCKQCMMDWLGKEIEICTD